MCVKIIIYLILSIVIGTHTVFAQTDTTTEDQHPKKKTLWFVERFQISAGFFVPVNNTVVQVSNTSGNTGTILKKSFSDFS